MAYSIRRTEDVEEARDLHALAFPHDTWVGDDQEYWIARDAGDEVVGFCSAKFFPEDESVVLTRAAVVSAAAGKGLQRRMIRVRVGWAKRIGAKAVVTYTAMKNYPSLINLLKCGFKLHTIPGWKNWHTLYLSFSGGRPTSIKMMLKTM